MTEKVTKLNNLDIRKITFSEAYCTIQDAVSAICFVCTTPIDSRKSSFRFAYGNPWTSTFNQGMCHEKCYHTLMEQKGSIICE